MNADKSDLYSVRIETDGGFAPLVEAGLELLNLEAVSWHTPDRVLFEIFRGNLQSAESCLALVTDNLRDWSDGEPWKTSLHVLPANGWQERWKEHFHAARVSRRLVVKPSWESWAAEPDDIVIEIDPGMSFGTGLHPTTRACLRFLDGHCVSRRNFIDLGCGSGILSIAAAGLGFGRICAIDHDPLAVETAKGNIERNGFSAVVQPACASLGERRSPETFEVVAANLFAGILIETAPLVAGYSSRTADSRLLLAGIRDDQYPGVKKAYGALGFREICRETEQGWTSGCFRGGDLWQ